MNEWITWIDVNNELPDCDIDVLIRTDCASYPVWIGSHDSVDWQGTDGVMLLANVTHWADMPAGPKA